ncbi:MAG: glycosyltransferase family 2 protein [Saprospiraceae bacterium]|nr:glycosyltransferase family 2 protein [Saprospiraceae bacterium]
MKNVPLIDVIIPAYNEEESVALVLQDIPSDWVREVIVCDNASSDRTADVALKERATVVSQPQKGYGSACLKGMEYVAKKGVPPDIIVFLDADYSDHPEELPKLIQPIVDQDYDLVIGSRALGDMEEGAMMPQQIFGNWLATNLIKLFYRYHFTDLGPFRAIKYQKLLDLGMNDPNFGWTVEMQVKAAKMKFRCTEVAVKYRRRVGISKVSGTVRGTILAGHKILWTIFKLL